MSTLSRRTFLCTVAAGAAAGLGAAAQRPRNVLFIASDDLNNALSCYGHPVVKTPNIDRIASRGVRFDRAYCQYPLCSPSRTSIMTGLGPDMTRVYDLQKHFRSTLPDVVTLGQAFQKNNYFTARVGKIYHYGVPKQIGTAGLDDPPSWNLAVNPAGVDHTKEEPLLTNYTPDRGIGSAVCFHSSDAKDEEHTDGITAGRISELLSEHRKGPVFLAAGFYRPHVPWIAPSKYFDMFPLRNIELTPFDQSEMSIAPDLAYWVRPANWNMTAAQMKDALRAYYAAIAFLDAQVGKVIDSLDRLKLADDTTIVFWSDHGYQLGEHGQWMKQTLFEHAARVPFMLAGAGVEARGRNCMRTVELIDIYPTLAQVCGLRDVPKNLQGRSLAPLLKNPDAAWDKPAVTQVNRPKEKAMGYSIRTERYRYTMWADGTQGEELYDYETDPRELKNRAKDEALSAIHAKLRRQLETIIKQRGGSPAA
jgi:uncharacterized sulfatase